MKILIKNGLVVNSNLSAPMDILIQDEKIVALLRPGVPSNFDLTEAEIVDAQGMHVLPGGVDPHCHIGFSSGQFSSLDNYEQATRAAVCGGTTTIVDFAMI